MDSVWRMLQPVRWVLRTLAVLLNNLYCIPTYVAWMFLVHPIYYINPKLYWIVEGEFFQWLLTCVGFWSYSAGYYIVESGDNIKNLMDEETLVLVNHQSTSDVPLLMHNFSAKNTLLQRLNWIMDAVFQYTNFGIVSTLHGDFFINAGRDRRDASLKDLESYLKNIFLPRERKWLVLFPEGGFLRKRKDASKRYAEKMGLPNLEHVTLPRLGAIQTIINTLAPTTDEGQTRRSAAGRLKYVIDMTIAYPDGDPLDLPTIVTGYRTPCKIQMHYNVYRIDEVPHQNEDELQKWLYDLYIKKNGMLEHYYATGIFEPELATGGSKPESAPNGRAPAVPEGDVVDRARESLPDNDGYLSRGVSSATAKSIENQSSDEVELEERSKEEEPKCDENCACEPLTDDERREYGSNYLRMDLLRVSLIHAMFITSTLFHCIVIGSVYQMYMAD
ncbi:Acyl-CoA:lysophosphatidylglycerol acyltransferase 1 [Orchesella cincta]|uniref:Acyl-CoA:lysophosphatidylglycerol acyltransferase 1 n=1 Tax=Orchesella cincta TaxID=48709 RepID=A0A1D2MYS5_ORCCI|nr:Acyl-CoA:lysophosphatidylglycerol acyltransferase 1 [Orchesella cincta]